MNIGFLGLGVMGFSMAGNLSNNSKHNVFVYNRTTQKSKNWAKKYKGDICLSPKEIATKCDVLLMCLGNDEDVLSVVNGEDGLLSGLKENSIVVDHTTTSSKLSKKLLSLFKTKNADFLDAPVSGGAEGAKNGALTTMIGGEEKTLKQVHEILECYCKNIVLVGANGSGQLAKMVNQICISGVLQGLSEGLKLAQAENLNIEALIKAIGGGAAQSWQMNNRAISMSKDSFDFGFAIDWMIKDLNYAMEQAHKNNLRLEGAEKVLDKYKELAKNGFNKCDTSVLIKSVK